MRPVRLDIDGFASYREPAHVDFTDVEARHLSGADRWMWGSDYPHLEGTYGHTQETLHELFDDVSADVRHRITRGAGLRAAPAPATAHCRRAAGPGDLAH